MAHLDVSQASTAGWGMARALRPTVWQAAVVVLVLAAIASFFPLRFAATVTLDFDVATQPRPSAVRGVAQVIASREMAYDAVQRLGPADATQIAGGSLAARLGVRPRASAEGRSDAMRAAWRLMDDLVITPVNSGRGLSLSLSAPTPALAERAADAYVAAFLALDAAAREGAEEAQALPALKRGVPPEASLVPDPPRPLAIALLLAAALLLFIARRQMSSEPVAEGRVDRAELPVELAATHRIAWLGGANAGLAPDEAVERLAAQVAAAGGRGGHLILLTSEELPDLSARCAISLARRLSDEARVALVALDGEAESLAALVSDPWAPGMSELLFGVAGFGETIHRDARSRAHVIPPGRDARGGPAVIGAERLALVLEALRRTYDHVVVAAPDLASARSGHRLAALDPLVVFLNPDAAPATSVVESFDALAAKRFARVVMLSMATGPKEALADADDKQVPSLDAEVADAATIPAPPPAALPPRLAGAA